MSFYRHLYKCVLWREIGLHVYKGLGVGKGVRQLDVLEDVAVAVYGRVTGRNYRAIGVEGVDGWQSCQGGYYEGLQ